MTEERSARLQRIQERVNKATPAPWYTANVEIPLHYYGLDHESIFAGNTKADAEFIANAREDIPFLLKALAEAQATITALSHENKMGHARLNECAGWEATKDLPLYDRISRKIQELSEAKSEVEHLLKASGHEMDVLRSRAEAAEHRRQAAEYRAQRIVLDAELVKRADEAEAALTVARARITQLEQEKEMQKEDYARGDGSCLSPVGELPRQATSPSERRLTCITCKQPILVTDEWSWLDGRKREPEHDGCYLERFARQFPRAPREY